MYKKEFIICSAVHFDDNIYRNEQPINIKSGIVFTGRRHNNCFYMLEQLGFKEKITKENTISGFLTSYDRFVNRREAFLIAKENNQLLYPNLHKKSIAELDNIFGKIDESDIILTSEDLYPLNEKEF